MIKIVNKQTGAEWHFENEDEFTMYKECEECGGVGEYWQQGFCARPMSECCGGCGDDVPCEECGGTGMIEVEIEV